MDLQQTLHDVAAAVSPILGKHPPADYIPGLASVDPGQFGICVADCSGAVFGAGQWNTPFSIQSISKVFTLALVLKEDGEELWQRVYREPSGSPFNSLLQLEHDAGIPRNPFINAGALVVTDRLRSLTGSGSTAVRSLLRLTSGNPTLDVDESIAASEAARGHRNASLAHLLASFGNLDNPVEPVLDDYTRHCALAMSCRDVAVAASFLAMGGITPDGERLLGSQQAKRINALMLTCGMYDASGEFAYRVGLPSKSGVGGGILAVAPGKGTICVWSPGLSKSGNSVAGGKALDEFTARTGWSVF